MKPVIRSLTQGQKVWATIEEVRSSTELLVNFDGDLLVVANQASRHFRPGQRVQLHVENLNPLSFRLVETRRMVFGLDVEV